MMYPKFSLLIIFILLPAIEESEPGKHDTATGVTKFIATAAEVRDRQ